MRILLAAAMLAALAASGCKTAGGGDSALREEGGAPAADASAWTNSRWMASIGDGGHQIEANMEIDDAGGILVANVDGQDHQLPFAGVRAATRDELTAFQRDVTNSVLDSRGNSVPVTRGLVLVDGGGSFLALLPIVSDQEIVLFPFGPMQRTANAGEEETIECGGFAGTPCPAGKVCKRPAGATADQKGKCVAGNATPPTQNPPVPQNNKCGGPGIQCPSPKVCKMPSPPTLHGWGVCVDPPPMQTPPPPTGIPGLGKSCGGFAGGCAAGLKCSSSGFNQPGKCVVDPNAGNNQGNNNAPAADPVEGRSCGGFAGGCPAGYKCSASGFNQTGVCKKSATPPPTEQAEPPANPDIGRSCGGFAGSCPAPLKCKKNGTGLNATGVCVAP